MQTIIQIPKIEDFEAVNRLAKQVHELHVKWRPDLFFSVEKVIMKSEFEEMIQNATIMVAKWQNEIVGYMTFSIQEKNHHGMRFRKQLIIDAICVVEKYRGKGIGSALLKDIRKIAKENSCTDLYLTVNEENENAIKMYEKFGMKVKNRAYSMEI